MVCGVLDSRHFCDMWERPHYIGVFKEAKFKDKDKLFCDWLGTRGYFGGHRNDSSLCDFAYSAIQPGHQGSNLRAKNIQPHGYTLWNVVHSPVDDNQR